MTWQQRLRIAWWLVLSIAGLAYLWARRTPVLAGATSSFDVVVLLVLLGLLLSPLFSEVKLWGLALKRELKETKAEIRQDLAGLKLNIVGLTQQTVSQNISFVTPPPDASLPAASERIIHAAEQLQERTQARAAETVPPPLSNQVLELFKLRYDIDREVRRIAVGRDLMREASGFEGRKSIFALTRVLERAEVVPPSIGEGIRDVYSVCSRAVHAEPVTAAQFEFAKSVGPTLVDALSRLA